MKVSGAVVVTIVAHSLLVVTVLGLGVLAFNGAIMLTALAPAVGLTWTAATAQRSPDGSSLRVANLCNLAFFTFLLAFSIAAAIYLAGELSGLQENEDQARFADLASMIVGGLLVVVVFVAVTAMVGAIGAVLEVRRPRFS